MVGDLSLLAVASASPVVLAPSKELHHGVLSFQGKKPQQDAARVLEAAYQGQQPVQMMVPGHGQAATPAYQVFAMPDAATLIDIQGPQPDSVQFSLGIAERCAREEKIMKFLMSGSDVKELDASLLAELTGHHNLPINMGSQPYIPDDKLSIYEIGSGEPQQYLQENQLIIPDPLVDFLQSCGSAITLDQDGRVLFTGIGDEMRDLLSVFLEISVPKQEASGCKASYLVPYFDRKRRGRNNSQVSNSILASTAVDASKSTENVKAKSPIKKKLRVKNMREDSYQHNYFHASETFLSILLDKDNSNSTILTLKKAGPEISELLTQCSIGIAGTGLAVLLSVVCKMATGGRAHFAATRLLNTGVGIGLFWLSWAVNGLRDTITRIFRGPSDLNLKDDEVAVQIQRSMNDIIFRAVALLAITALKFA